MAARRACPLRPIRRGVPQRHRARLPGCKRPCPPWRCGARSWQRCGCGVALPDVAATRHRRGRRRARRGASGARSPQCDIDRGRFRRGRHSPRTTSRRIVRARVRQPTLPRRRYGAALARCRSPLRQGGRRRRAGRMDRGARASNPPRRHSHSQHSSTIDAGVPAGVRDSGARVSRCFSALAESRDRSQAGASSRHLRRSRRIPNLRRNGPSRD